SIPLGERHRPRPEYPHVVPAEGVVRASPPAAERAVPLGIARFALRARDPSPSQTESARLRALSRCFQISPIFLLAARVSTCFAKARGRPQCRLRTASPYVPFQNAPGAACRLQALHSSHGQTIRVPTLALIPTHN